MMYERDLAPPCPAPACAIRARRFGRRICLWLAAGLVVALAAAGCDRGQSDAPDPDPGAESGIPAEEEGASGAPAEVPSIEPPGIPVPVEGLATRRVVSLLPSVTEMLADLGVGSALVGRTLHCDHPEWVGDLPSVGSGLDPDLEVILSLQPELVVAGRMQARLPVMSALEHRDMDVIVVPDERLEDVFDALRLLGGRLGVEERAEERVAEIRAGLGLVAMQAPSERLRVLIAVGHDPIYAAGRETFLDDVLEVAGGTNVLERTGWVHLDREAVLAMRPDLVLAAGDREVLAERWRFLVEGVGARLCVVQEDLTARQGPRVAEAAAEYSACLRRHAPIAPPGE